MSSVCERRSEYESHVHFQKMAEHKKFQLPHLFTSRKRIVGQEWGPYTCSWCGVKENDRTY